MKLEVLRGHVPLLQDPRRLLTGSRRRAEERALLTAVLSRITRTVTNVIDPTSDIQKRVSIIPTKTDRSSTCCSGQVGRLLQTCGLEHLNRNGLKEKFPVIIYDNSPINLNIFTRGRLQNNNVYYLVLSPGGSRRFSFLRTVQTSYGARERPAQ